MRYNVRKAHVSRLPEAASLSAASFKAFSVTNDTMTCGGMVGSTYAGKREMNECWNGSVGESGARE